MLEFNSILKQQHQQIKDTFGSLQKAWKDQDEKDSLQILEKLKNELSEHHATEYQLLFLKLFRNPKLQAGGPFCTYFYDFFMTNRPFDAALRRINQIRTHENKLKAIAIPVDLQTLFDENSMLCIPIEEHLALTALVNELQSVLSGADLKEEIQKLTWVSSAIDDLSTLISRNIEKEETCLWAIAQGLCLK